MAADRHDLTLLQPLGYFDEIGRTSACLHIVPESQFVLEHEDQLAFLSFEHCRSGYDERVSEPSGFELDECEETGNEQAIGVGKCHRQSTCTGLWVDPGVDRVDSTYQIRFAQSWYPYACRGVRTEVDHVCFENIHSNFESLVVEQKKTQLASADLLSRFGLQIRDPTGEGSDQTRSLERESSPRDALLRLDQSRRSGLDLSSLLPREEPGCLEVSSDGIQFGERDQPLLEGVFGSLDGFFSG